MPEEKILNQQTIDDIPFPDQEQESFSTSQSSSGGVIGMEKIKNQNLPHKRIAVELLSSALNTKSRKILAEFEFTEHGSIQIGKYANGVSGDLRITPNGITARNISGLTTFNLDAETGDAVFKGTIQTGAVIAGEIVVGNNTWVIDGDSDHPMIILYNDGTPEIVIGNPG